MKGNKVQKILAVATIGTLVFANSHVIAAESNSQKKLDDINNQINNNNKAISSTEQEANKYLDEISTLNKQIGEYSTNLDDLQKKVDEVNAKIASYEDMLQNSAQKYSSAEDMYLTRLRAIYENGVPSMIDIFFQADGISDFFSKMNVYQGILEYDKSLVGNVKDEKEYISNVKKDIEIQKLQLDQLKYDVEKSTNALNQAKDQKQNKVNQLNASKDKLASVNKVLQEEAENLNKQIEREIAEEQERARKAAEEEAKKNQGNGGSNSGGSNNGGGNVNTNPGGLFQWPTPGNTNITAGFPKYPDGSRHDGIDIGVRVGTPVYAAQAGLVVKSKYYLTGDYDGGYRDGYGNTVWISNGDYTVIYGHLKYVQVVKEGQYVQKGQLVAYSASTGNSTGPHLHFEIRKGTKAIDPRQFF